jgi:hypothetical protein
MVFWEGWEAYTLNQKPPAPWVSAESSPNMTIRVVNTRAYGGSKSLYYYSNGTVERAAYAYRDLDGVSLDGTITLWLYVDSYNYVDDRDYYRIDCSQTGLSKFIIGLGKNGKLMRVQSWDTWYEIGDYSLDTWFKLTIVFDTALDTYTVYKDGVSLGTFPFRFAATGIDRIYIGTGSSPSAAEVYCDSICFN